MADQGHHDHSHCTHDHSRDPAHAHSHDIPHTDGSSNQAATLKITQAPIKEGYRKDPSSALVTLKSFGTLDSQSITCSLDGPNAKAIKGAHKKVAGLHSKAGGPDAAISGELCSGDMLLEALVACSGVTLKAVATALEIPIERGTVFAEGDLDFKGTLGVDKAAPVGFTAIRLGFDLRMKRGYAVEDEKLAQLGKLTERYCVVLQTIAKKPELIVRVEGIAESEEGLDRGGVWIKKV